jgi:hypothetical protein
MRAARRTNQEGPHASIAIRPCPPPRPKRLKRPGSPRQLWMALPAADRDQILSALSRVLAEHLARPVLPGEVTHEQP